MLLVEQLRPKQATLFTICYQYAIRRCAEKLLFQSLNCPTFRTLLLKVSECLKRWPTYLKKLSSTLAIPTCWYCCGGTPGATLWPWASTCRFPKEPATNSHKIQYIMRLPENKNVYSSNRRHGLRIGIFSFFHWRINFFFLILRIEKESGASVRPDFFCSTTPSTAQIT